MAKEYKKLYKYTYNHGRILCEELEIKEEKEGKYWIRKGRFKGNTKAIRISDIGKIEASIDIHYVRVQYVVLERNDEEFKRLLNEEFDKQCKRLHEIVNEKLTESKIAIAHSINFEVVSCKPPKKKVIIVDGLNGGIERYELKENENIEEAINERHINYDNIKVDDKDEYYNSNVNIIKEDKEPII